MRMLIRNGQVVYYALFDKKNEIVDEYGNGTGSFEIIYSDIQHEYMNVSAARGTSDLEQFGINNPYTRTLVTGNMDCPIEETSVLWIGKKIVLPYDATEDVPEGAMRIDGNRMIKRVNGAWKEVPYNYVVVGVAKSLNSITYAIKEVEVG